MNRGKLDANSVAIYDAAYDQSMEDVISRIMEAAPCPWKDKKVLIKPNMLAPHDPEQGVTTHPSIVRAVVDYLQGQGAEVMVGDNPGLGGYGISKETARVCGILSAYKKRGQVQFHELTKLYLSPLSPLLSSPTVSYG